MYSDCGEPNHLQTLKENPFPPRLASRWRPRSLSRWASPAIPQWSSFMPVYAQKKWAWIWDDINNNDAIQEGCDKLTSPNWWLSNSLSQVEHVEWLWNWMLGAEKKNTSVIHWSTNPCEAINSLAIAEQWRGGRVGMDSKAGCALESKTAQDKPISRTKSSRRIVRILRGSMKKGFWFSEWQFCSSWWVSHKHRYCECDVREYTQYMMLGRPRVLRDVEAPLVARPSAGVKILAGPLVDWGIDIHNYQLFWYLRTKVSSVLNRFDMFWLGNLVGFENEVYPNKPMIIMVSIQISNTSQFPRGPVGFPAARCRMLVPAMSRSRDLAGSQVSLARLAAGDDGMGASWHIWWRWFGTYIWDNIWNIYIYNFP